MNIPLWLLLPVCTPVGVMAAALALQHLERKVLVSDKDAMARPGSPRTTYKGRAMAKHRKPSEDLDMHSGLSWHQQLQVVRVVASASVDADECALLLAALGLDAVGWSSLDDHNR